MKAVGLAHHLPIDKPEFFLDVDLPKPAPTGQDGPGRPATVAPCFDPAENALPDFAC